MQCVEVKYDIMSTMPGDGRMTCFQDDALWKREALEVGCGDYERKDSCNVGNMSRFQ